MPINQLYIVVSGRKNENPRFTIANSLVLNTLSVKRLAKDMGQNMAGQTATPSSIAMTKLLDSFGGMLLFGAWLACVIFGIRNLNRAKQSPHWMWLAVLHPLVGVVMFVSSLVLLQNFKTAEIARKEREELQRRCTAEAKLAEKAKKQKEKDEKLMIARQDPERLKRAAEFAKMLASSRDRRRLESPQREQRIAGLETNIRQEHQDEEVMSARHDPEDRGQKRAAELAEMRRVFASYSKDRLYLESAQRERRIAGLEADIRQENQEHDAFLDDRENQFVDRTTIYNAHAEIKGGFQAQIDRLNEEIEIIKEVI